MPNEYSVEDGADGDSLEEGSCLIHLALVTEVERRRSLVPVVMRQADLAARSGFRDIGTDDVGIILGINCRGLSDSSPNRVESVVCEHVLVNEEMKRRWGISGFLAYDEESGVPTGCTIVRVRESKKDPMEPVLRIHSMVTLPDLETGSIGGMMFLRVLEMAAKNGLAVEIMCRESTSYRAFRKRDGDMFQGFMISVDTRIVLERDGENYYFVRLDPRYAAS